MERAGVCHGNAQCGVFPDNTPDVWGGTDIIREVGSGIGVDLHRHTALIGPRENTVVIGTVHGVAGIGGVNFYAQKFFLFQGLFQEFQGRFDRVADIDIRETEEAVFRLQAHGEQVIMDGAGLKIHGEHVGNIERHDAGSFDMVLIHEL